MDYFVKRVAQTVFFCLIFGIPANFQLDLYLAVNEKTFHLNIILFIPWSFYRGYHAHALLHGKAC
jgi:hypothetical protein